MATPHLFREHVIASMSGHRILPDVSVLLAAILDSDSASGQVLEIAKAGTIVLSEHVEDMARTVLRAHAPGLLPVFNDGLLRLGAGQTIERLPRQQPTGGRCKLSAEDAQVLSDAIGGKVSVLITHDAALFRAAPVGLSVKSPSTLTWEPLDARNIQRGDEMTFIGWFLPQWSSEAVAGSTERFYFFEIDRFARAYYDAKKGEARLEWGSPKGVHGSLRMPQIVRVGEYHFVAAVLRVQTVFLFIDGVSRGRRTRIGAPPSETTFHPFMSASSEHQIFGTCHFRMEPRALGESELRRLWVTHSTRLSDGEIRFADWSRHSSLLISPADVGIVNSWAQPQLSITPISAQRPSRGRRQ